MKIKFLSSDSKFADNFLEWRQDPQTIKYNPLAPSNRETLRQRLSSSASDLTEFDKSDAFLWFIDLNGELAGQVNIQNINRMMLTAEIGYTIAPSSRSKGVATAAVRLLTENVFAGTPLRKLIAYVHDGNIPSKKVLEKVGYKQEGLLREHYIVNGIPTDEAIYGILKGEVI